MNANHLSDGDVDLANDQGWVCRLCGMDLINGEELHRHHKRPTSHGRLERARNRELVHLYCHQQETKRSFAGEAGPADDLDRIRAVSDLLEPYEAKVSSTVLRGGGGGDTAPLPDTVYSMTSSRWG